MTEYPMIELESKSVCFSQRGKNRSPTKSGPHAQTVLSPPIDCLDSDKRLRPKRLSSLVGMTQGAGKRVRREGGRQGK